MTFQTFLKKKCLKTNKTEQITCQKINVIREGLRIIKDEVIFVINLGGKKYLFVQMF